MLLKKACTPYGKLEKFFTEPYNEKNFLFFFRIMISFIALIEITALATDLSLFFSASGTLVPQELMYLPSDSFKYLYPLYQFLENQGLNDIFYPGIIYAYCIALIFMGVGLMTRYVSFIALILQLIIFRSFSPFNYGFDYFLTMSLFYCFIFPTGKYYAIDAQIFRYDPVIKFNYRRIIQVHLAIAYCFSGIAKGLDSGWWNGNSIWRAITSVDNSYYAYPSFLLIIAGIGTVLLEFLYPALIICKNTRKYAVMAMILMHLSIAVMMNLYVFSAIMIVWNIAAFTSLTATKSFVHVETA